MEIPEAIQSARQAFPSSNVILSGPHAEASEKVTNATGVVMAAVAVEGDELLARAPESGPGMAWTAVRCYWPERERAYVALFDSGDVPDVPFDDENEDLVCSEIPPEARLTGTLLYRKGLLRADGVPVRREAPIPAYSNHDTLEALRREAEECAPDDAPLRQYEDLEPSAEKA